MWEYFICFISVSKTFNLILLKEKIRTLGEMGGVREDGTDICSVLAIGYFTFIILQLATTLEVGVIAIC